MFEKEAEEYATRECCMTCNNINHFCKEKCECWTFAKKGVEFGYNKAFVEADKNLKAIVTDFNKAIVWRKVADGDLPNNYRYVWTNVGAGYHDDDGWWDDFGRLQNVIAWCEPKFEE